MCKGLDKTKTKQQPTRSVVSEEGESLPSDLLVVDDDELAVGLIEEHLAFVRWKHDWPLRERHMRRRAQHVTHIRFVLGDGFRGLRQLCRRTRTALAARATIAKPTHTMVCFFWWLALWLCGVFWCEQGFESFSVLSRLQPNQSTRTLSHTHSLSPTDEPTNVRRPLNTTWSATPLQIMQWAARLAWLIAAPDQTPVKYTHTPPTRTSRSTPPS
jgi:hypothetical protein